MIGLSIVAARKSVEYNGRLSSDFTTRFYYCLHHCFSRKRVLQVTLIITSQIDGEILVISWVRDNWLQFALVDYCGTQFLRRNRNETDWHIIEK